MALAREIDADGFQWHPPAPETNSFAVLSVHTLGNAEENILETLCGQPINRDRESEFATPGRTQDSLSEICHHPRRGEISGREVLIVVAHHSAEHLGQAELTRDLWQARVTT